jgi:ferritin-like metal-binding protein YciE
MATEDVAQAINSYVTDMLALEKHIEKAIAGQIEDLDEDDPGFVQELKGIKGTIEQHISALEALAERRQESGQKMSDMVKRAASNVLGAGAAAVDFLRGEKLPKNLRDDYTAMSLASIGYVMLYTTATSLDDREVADLAMRHLENHARCVESLHRMIPAAVVKFLQKDGLPARDDLVPEITRTVASVWEGEPGVLPPGDASTRMRSGDPLWERSVERGIDADLR